MDDEITFKDVAFTTMTILTMILFSISWSAVFFGDQPEINGIMVAWIISAMQFVLSIFWIFLFYKMSISSSYDNHQSTKLSYKNIVLMPPKLRMITFIGFALSWIWVCVVLLSFS